MAYSPTWLIGAGAKRRQVRILFSCAGRRVELMRAFVKAARALRLKPLIHASDTAVQFAAGAAADQTHQVPLAKDRGYIPRLLEVVEKNKIDLVVPLLDLELMKLARARERFAELGCGVLISPPKVIDACADKFKTHDFLVKHGIDTPATWKPEEILKRTRHTFPYYMKPAGGSASKGNHVIRNKDDLVGLVGRVPDPVIQELVPGIEHTLDVYTGFDGRPRCVVPRQRVEVRGGEVTKARTVKHHGIIETGVRVAEALRDCVGLITVQLILVPDGRMRVIEVNPRFGGGVPLAIRAGANFPRWILSEWMGKKPKIKLADFEHNLLMLRYHDSFFSKGQGFYEPGEA